MWSDLILLFKKDFKMLAAGRFFLLTAGTIILYSCYINFVYINIDQDIYPVYMYDPFSVQEDVSSSVIKTDSMEELLSLCSDGYAVGIDSSNLEPQIFMASSGIKSTDHYRMAYALSTLSSGHIEQSNIIGRNNRIMKNRREITAEFLFFELTAIGFLGMAALLFKEKQMGVIKVHGILPINRNAFILSRLIIFLLSDLIYAAMLTMINLGVSEGTAVLPSVLSHTAIMSMFISLTSFLCAMLLQDFKQFSLLYLVLAVFITTPVFLAGQTSVALSGIEYHPVYHLFMALKSAYFNAGLTEPGIIYYFISAAVICILFLLARRGLTGEMTKG